MLYKIGDVARILGVSPDILRYYEKKGLLKKIDGAQGLENTTAAILAALGAKA